MPELPEVEVIRAGLTPLIERRQVSAVDVFHPRPIRAHEAGVADFVDTVVGQTFAAVRRRGKYLWLATTGGDALIVHLGMSGQFRWNHRDDEPLAHTRVVFSFVDTCDQLRFVDQRMFGGLTWSSGGAELPEQIAHIARDLFDPECDVDVIATRITTKQTTIKRALLDQSVVSGIGNIYADEALWRAGFHGECPTSTLSRENVLLILRSAREVMVEALAQGGTSFDALYVHVNGSSGYFSRSLSVYGRQGKPCQRCGNLIVRQRFMNRSSYCCLQCQKTAESHISGGRRQ